MWEVYTEGRVPYENRTNTEVVEDLNAGIRLLKPRQAPQPLYDLMQWCWKEVCYDMRATEKLEENGLLP